MAIAYFDQAYAPRSVIRTFQRRECLPMIENLLWQIDAGMVRTLTMQEEGNLIMLGLWGAGDVVGHPLAGIDPYYIECLGRVQVHRLEDCQALESVMLSHIHQSQILLSVGHGPVLVRLKRFLAWLADKFGTKTQDGWYIPHQLTHQDIAEAIGTTRVTVCRLLSELEEDHFIGWSRKSCHLLQ